MPDVPPPPPGTPAIEPPPATPTSHDPPGSQPDATPLASPGSQPVAAPEVDAAPDTPISPLPASGSKIGLTIALALVVALVVGGLVYLFVLRGGGGELSLPDEVQDQPKLQGGLTDSVINDLEKQQVAGANAEAAFYGTQTQPAYFIVGFEISGEGESEEFFQGFQNSFTGSVDESQRVTEDRDGVNYSCVPITGADVAAAPGLTCLWTDEATLGAIVSFLGETPQEGINLAAAIHEEVVG